MQHWMQAVTQPIEHRPNYLPIPVRTPDGGLVGGHGECPILAHSFYCW